MGEPLTPSGVFLRNGLLALGFDEAGANEQVIAIEIEAADLAVKEIDAARAAAPSPTEAAIEHVKNMDRPMEDHKVECLERWVDVPGYGRMPARLMDPFECICAARAAAPQEPVAGLREALDILDVIDGIVDDTHPEGDGCPLCAALDDLRAALHREDGA